VRPYTLVLLHGQPGLGADWEQVIAALPDHVEVIAPDRPGHGSSTTPGGGLDINAAAVIDELDERGIDRAVLVGHSYGGGVALRVAATAQERVDGLVLLASVGPGCLNVVDWVLAAPVVGALCSVLAWKLTPWIARAVLRLGARNHARQVRPRLHAYWYAWGCTFWLHGQLWRTFLAEQKALVREAGEFGRLAASVRVPSLVVADPHDMMVPFRTAAALVQTLPDASLEVIKRAGHHLPLRAPEQVAGQIARYLESLPAADAKPHR